MFGRANLYVYSRMTWLMAAGRLRTANSPHWFMRTNKKIDFQNKVDNMEGKKNTTKKTHPANTKHF